HADPMGSGGRRLEAGGHLDGGALGGEVVAKPERRSGGAVLRPNDVAVGTEEADPEAGLAVLRVGDLVWGDGLEAAAVTDAGGGGGASSATWVPTCAARRRSRRTFTTIAGSGTRPSRTAATSWSPHGLSGPGMARSRAARPAASVERVAVQSETTTPSKPHSPFRGSASRSFSVMVTPLTPW